MATTFNGADISFAGTALECTDVTFSPGEVPRVDATNAGSEFKQYLAGIPEADSVTVTGFVSPGAPGTEGVFSGGTIDPGSSTTYRIESVEESGTIDTAITYTSNFVRVAS